MSLVYKIYFYDTDCVCVFKYTCPAGYLNLTVQVIKQDCEPLMVKEKDIQAASGWSGRIFPPGIPVPGPQGVILICLKHGVRDTT